MDPYVNNLFALFCPYMAVVSVIWKTMIFYIIYMAVISVIWKTMIFYIIFTNYLFLFYEDRFNLCCLFFSWNHSVLCCREPNAEQKFKEISNAYEVKVLLIHGLASTVWLLSIKQLVYWQATCAGFVRWWEKILIRQVWGSRT